MPRRVREPVQVYLDAHDRDLLEDLARRTGLARAELLRRGLRQLGIEGNLYAAVLGSVRLT